MEQPSIGLEIRALNNLIRRYFEFSSHRQEITAGTGNNGRIIGFLARNAHRDIYQKDIEAHFTITRSTASRVLALMMRKGLIEKQSVSHDARLRKIVLTERAWQMADLMRQDAENMECLLLQGLTDQEIRLLRGYLHKMKHNIAGGRACPDPAPKEGIL